MEFWTAKFRHPVENADADLNFCFLVVEVPRFELWSDHSLPSAHLGLTPAAQIVAGRFLPGHSATGLDLLNMPVSNRWIERRLRAENCCFGRRDNDLQICTKACLQKITAWCSIVGAIGNKLG
ncbi:hypothetical protein, partial [Bacillus anthracis]|uniref:hypothetical protein n=1 Tax=Bacillus anthracis TaxID=1392 RepID=UPI0039A69C7A